MRLHDAAAEHTMVGTNHYLRELERRDQDRQTQAMVRYTRWITLMTSVTTVATLVNIGIAVVALSR